MRSDFSSVYGSSHRISFLRILLISSPWHEPKGNFLLCRVTMNYQRGPWLCVCGRKHVPNGKGLPAGRPCGGDPATKISKV